MGNNPCPSYGKKIPLLIQQILNASYDIKKTKDDENINKLLQSIESSMREVKKVAKIVNPKLKKAHHVYLRNLNLYQFYYILNGV